MPDRKFQDPAAGAYHIKPGMMHDRLNNERPVVVRFFAHVFSFIFHPLFIPVYLAAFLIYVHPYAFAPLNGSEKMLKMISVILATAFFPAFTVFLLKRLGFIKSVFLTTQRDRIIPYVASMFFFFWIFYVSRNLPDSPAIFSTMLLGVFLSSIAALLANIYFKVSMHGIAMGAMVTFFLILTVLGSFALAFFLTISIIIAGVVCTSRLIVSDHHPFEVYAGFFLGVISQTLAVFFS